MDEISFVIWKEGRYYVSQCLNVDVSSFGKNVEEAKKNLREAVELYFEKENITLQKIDDIIVGKEKVNA
ncbi:HicB family protein [Candidatus Desantisbacteria bacterium CG1_02_38_46]|uniref:HicB family protein n=3 Tax=unclassified Candidatus Desantisiibacteriota TaxID=3106372 RepID=A0A2H9PC58_9BACT|nr:MAG: HicB family protein [Candidatus Desantisbacteria bacterium CG1_02_38_46]PIU51491.1 MAG: HicB family protein [Candidatus Desantisbacteria bacterium CG07_land_8_20_14_0_80_39_15]PIZ16704.1 MAG: HicB family protein [Candidatus Desantisbacteria bacterium CG_4_10_14_0_8_um_filter_39_17]